MRKKQFKGKTTIFKKFGVQTSPIPKIDWCLNVIRVIIWSRRHNLNSLKNKTIFKVLKQVKYHVNLYYKVKYIKSGKCYTHL